MCEPPRRPRMRKRVADRPVEAPGFVVVEGVGGTDGIDAGTPQHFVAEQVAEAGDRATGP